jgi:RNA polymerase sigma-70 factor (ECF subfamily)
MSSDAQLVSRVLAGDARAAEALFRRHWPASWRAALAICGSPAAAEDAAQDGWVRAVGALAAYDATRPFAPWLRRIVVHCAIDAAHRGRAFEGAVPVGAGDAAEPDDALVAAVARLPLERRTVVALRFWADLSVPEIAEALGIPTGTASSRLTRALDELRTMPEVRR